MKQVTKILSLFAIALLISCGGNEEKKTKSVPTIGGQATEAPKAESTPAVDEVPPSKRVDMVSKGIGPIKSLDLPETIDEAMAATGQEVFKAQCTACHKPTKRFIGPAPTGIMERRTPEWIMNMILNPEEMTKDDPLAHELLVEFNGSPMANQNLSEEEARQILEYFRTL